MASIAIAQAGGRVTVLEAAAELGEIGAGIQMTCNVSRLLIRYGVDKAIGENLVRFERVNMRRKDGKQVGHTPLTRVEGTLGLPWWLVHRHHLHTGLVEVAKQSGVTFMLDSRVASLEYEHQEGEKVTVRSTSGKAYTFDLLVGADGVNSIVRKTLHPGVKPSPPTGDCAYRAIVPYDEIRKDPIAKELVEDENGNLKKTMEVWMAPSGYIIAYPISNARDFNMVLTHRRDPFVDAVQEVDLKEVLDDYKDYDPRIRRIIEIVKPGIQRWPLLVTGPLDTWSSREKNVVLMGDSAHSMVNHMAQGAATSMEDGVYLARCLAAVMEGSVSIREAVTIYEKGRMPKATYKQEVSYLNGVIWHLDGAAAEARDKAMEPELRGEYLMRSPNLYGDPSTVMECYGYDAEAHADEEISRWLNGGKDIRDARTRITMREADKIVNWCLPAGAKYKIQPRL